MLQSLFVLCVGILQSTSAGKRQQVYNRCPNGSVAHDNSCYKVANALASWTDALVLCEAYGGHLARIDSDSEQQFITGHLKNHLASSTDPAHYYWIGATDAISEGEWYWAKVVEPVKYTNWSPGQPDNDNSHASKHQDCLAIFGQTGKWDDGWCPENHNFICEFEFKLLYGEPY